MRELLRTTWGQPASAVRQSEAPLILPDKKPVELARLGQPRRLSHVVCGSYAAAAWSPLNASDSAASTTGVAKNAEVNSKSPSTP